MLYIPRLARKEITRGEATINTYVDHPVLRRMSVRTAQIQPVTLLHGLYHSYVIPAVKVLKNTPSRSQVYYTHFAFFFMARISGS